MAGDVQSLYNNLNKAVELLKKDEQEARTFFNSTVYPCYGKAIWDDASPLRFMSFFFTQLDEYLNNSGYRLFGQTSLESIVGSFNSDFQAEYAEALRDEEKRSAA